MADFDDKIRDGVDNAQNGMGNFRDEADERMASLRDDEDDTS